MQRGARYSIALTGSFVLGLAGAACIQAPSFAPPALPRFSGSESVLPTGIGGTTPASEQMVTPTEPARSLSASSALGRPTAAVRLGTLSETLALTGRISSADEAAIRVQVAGQVEKVHVSLGQSVEPGQLLVELNTKELVKELTAQRNRLDAASLRLAQAIQLADQRRMDAEAEARRAAFELAQARAGAPAVDRQAAEAAILAARSGLERAEADLERIKAGPTAMELRENEQIVAAARAAIQKAEAELARLKRGADPTDLANADREVLNAQAALERAQVDLDRLQRGPDPADVAAAERELERARIGLRAAQSTSTSGSTRAQRDAAISAAEASVRDAEARLDRVRQSARADDIALARRSVDVARANLSASQERQSQIRRVPDPAVVSAAALGVDQAKLALESAELRYRTVQAGPTQQQLGIAAAAVDSARAAYIASQSRLAELNRRGTGADALRAEDRAISAAAAADRARDAASVDPDHKNAAALDLLLLQKEVRDLQTQVDLLDRQVTDGSARAPFTGQVSAIQIRPGDTVEPSQVVVSIARPANPIVIVDLSDEQRDRLAEGQSAAVRLDGQDPVPARLSAIAMSGAGSRIARLAPDTSLPRAGVGAVVQVNVTLTQRDNVLLVSRKAVRSAGTRRYVEQLDSGSRRLIDVQVGQTSGDDIEILGGLMSGELVLLPT
ncbi:MAG: HlyD family efflux transporter periplasmic adaptor subunit [Chloroflexota bacterium]